MEAFTEQLSKGEGKKAGAGFIRPGKEGRCQSGAEMMGEGRDGLLTWQKPERLGIQTRCSGFRQ